MVHLSRSRGFGMWCALVVVLLFGLVLGGCGAAKSEMAGVPMAPEAPAADMPAEPESANRTLEADDAREEAPVALYRNSAGPAAPGRATGGMAQATPPVAKPVDASKKNDVPPTAGQQPETGVATGGEGKAAVAAPMLIYKANIYMAVFETKKSIDAVEQLAKDSGGYLVSREDNRITVRVPASKFDGTLDKITKLGDMLHRNVSVQDVTSEYFDLSIRLRNLEAMRDRFEELLKKATKVEEALAVERELERVAGEIERLKGRLKLLRELVTFSTITVEFQPRPTDHIDNKVRLPFPWLDRLGLGDLLRL